MPGLKFPADTLDRIEKLFADEILKNFPYYGIFWEKFVGRDENNTSLLLPYRLEFPSNMSHAEKEAILNAHNNICLFHYSLFCQLAGAHFQLEQTVAALNEKDPQERHFLFWEAFDNFYTHLGNARFQMLNLWEETCKITCMTLRYPPDENGLKQYLQDNSQNDLVNKIEKIKENVIKLRNNLVHYARNAFILIEGKYFIPLPIKRDPKLSEMLNHREAQEVTKKMEFDLMEFEKMLNEILPFIAKELDKGFDMKGIKIRR